MAFTLATEHERQAFDTVDGLADAVEILRGRRGLQAVPSKVTLSDDDAEAHAGFTLYATPKDGQREFMAAAIAPGVSLTVFMAALRQARAQRRAA